MKLRCYPALILMGFLFHTTLISAQGEESSLPQPTHQPPIWHSSHPPSFSYEDLVSNYWELYPRGEDVVMESVQPLANGVGLRIQLKSEKPDVSHYIYTINGGSRRKSKDGILHIEFEDNHTLENFSKETRRADINVVYEDGSQSSSHYIVANFYPSEQYIANGRIEDGHGRIHVRESDIKYATSAVNDWILDDPTPEEIAFAKDKWGHLVKPDRTAYENARAIMVALLEDLNPHRGTPSDKMDTLKPFDQYKRLVDGEDHCWCANICEIFSYACNSLGIPARFIIMRHQLYPPPDNVEEGYEVLLAGGHTTMEIFNEDDGQWIWMDPTWNTLGAYLGEEGPLNLMELYRFAHQPARFKRLSVEILDSETNSIKRYQAAESPIHIKFQNAFKQDQLFRYMRR